MDCEHITVLVGLIIFSLLVKSSAAFPLASRLRPRETAALSRLWQMDTWKQAGKSTPWGGPTSTLTFLLQTQHATFTCLTHNANINLWTFDLNCQLVVIRRTVAQINNWLHGNQLTGLAFLLQFISCKDPVCMRVCVIYPQHGWPCVFPRCCLAPCGIINDALLALACLDTPVCCYTCYSFRCMGNF